MKKKQKFLEQVSLTLIHAHGHTHIPYLLETSLDQVLWEQVPDEVKEGIQAGDLIMDVALSQLLLHLGVARVDDQHQDHSQDGSNDGGGHVVDHGPGSQTATGFGIQTSQSWQREQNRMLFRATWVTLYRK